MTFDEFSVLFTKLYRAQHNRDPFSITIRRAFNRHRHLPAPTVVRVLTEELAA